MNTIEKLKTLKRIRKIATVLDSAIGIPGTKFRIGLDPILGLIQSYLGRLASMVR